LIHQSEETDKRKNLDLAWNRLLEQRSRLRSPAEGTKNDSNEITTSQLAKLFQNADQRTLDLLELYGPLNCADRNGYVVAHLGQSLDGRIAAVNGASRWITGKDDVIHNHRMRALSDAVVVGGGTVYHDDPKLTVRDIAGHSPVRIVLDPGRRLEAHYEVFTDGEVETLLLCREQECGEDEQHGQARIMGLASDERGLIPEAVLAALRKIGLTRIFVEGGGKTVSRFLEAGCLDRLQITVAPVILGSGRPSISLPEISDVADGLRPAFRRFRLGDDTLFECCFDDRE